VAGRVNLPLFPRTLTQTQTVLFDANGLSFLSYHTVATLLFQNLFVITRKGLPNLFRFEHTVGKCAPPGQPLAIAPLY
jgi:hypothetical protein